MPSTLSIAGTRYEDCAVILRDGTGVEVKTTVDAIVSAMTPRAAKVSRFILEGEWSGYRSSQQRVVHRVLIPARRRDFIEWAKKTHAISYTDGTCLYLTIRPAKPREKIAEIHGYDSLIDECFSKKATSVAALAEARAEEA